MSIFESILNNINAHIDNTSSNIETLTPHIAEAIHLFSETLLNDKKIFCCTCSNSFPAGYQFCHQLMNGTLLQRPSLPIIFLNMSPSNSSNISVYENYSRQLSALAQRDDLFFIISNSTEDEAISNALLVAQEKSMTIVALMPHQQASTLKIQTNNVIISINADDVQQISSLHFLLSQMLATLIEQQLFGSH